MVLADSAAIAEDALELIEVDIEAVAGGRRPARVRARRSVAVRGAGHQSSPSSSMPSAAMPTPHSSNAPYVRARELPHPPPYGLPMEPRGLLAEWDAAQGRLTVSGGAKVLFFNRRILAKEMGLPEERDRDRSRTTSAAASARAASSIRKTSSFRSPRATLGRPVKWIEDRRENLMCLNHAREAECDVEIACTRDGTILGLRGHAYVDVGAYMRTNGAVGARNIAQFMSGPYRIPQHRYRRRALADQQDAGRHLSRARPLRDRFLSRAAARHGGAGPAASTASSSAAAISVTRRRCRIRSPPSRRSSARTSSTAATISQTLDRCLDGDRTGRRSRKLQGKLIDGRYHGLALGCFIEGGAAGPKETARMVLEPTARISVYVGSSAIGQGSRRSFAQIAADALEVPMTASAASFTARPRMSATATAPITRARW